MRRILLGLICSSLLVPAMRGQGTEKAEARSFATRITSDLAIVTSVSKTNPYLGEQFSVIYRLRAGRAPDAVDIDPQQYAGFWTQVVALPEQKDEMPRDRKGQAETEYLLRQVIAYPLVEGALTFPPIRLKIKQDQATPRTGSIWDVVGMSEPVNISVRALPISGAPVSATPLVGYLDGTLTQTSGRSGIQINIELAGTANLAFIQPLEWLHNPQNVAFSLHLADSDNIVQTRQTGDNRELALLQRRHWSAFPLGVPAGGIRIPDIEISVFKPDTGEWITKRMPGVDIVVPAEGPLDSESLERPRAAVQTVGYGPFLPLSGIGAIFIIAAATYWLRRRRLRRT